ncbi:MAG: NAD(P)H-dependent oxidoreductase, partial [Alicyclobacillus sp.]|nr:NAD(P)H-dependent oxidoreductase [Alicyclobacillus sp.]
MKAVALVGSLRKDSYNMKLARFLQERYRNHWEMEIVDISSLPFYNQDQEEAPPPVVSQFKQQIRNADAVMIVTPEYNWSIPGVLKNALDWLSRVDRVINQKPVLVAGASQSLLGTVRAQLHLREILSSPGLA